MPKLANVKIAIDSKSCKKCGICQGFCAQEVYSLAKDGAPSVDRSENCNYCRLCELRCPDFAIRLEVLS